jgi:acyl-CoA synthetase (AMP-forming)/AMP-acid ligase II
VEKRRRAAGLTQGKLEGFERLRTGIAAGAPVPIDLMKRLINEMGLTELTNAYGMSECNGYPLSLLSRHLCSCHYSTAETRYILP